MFFKFALFLAVALCTTQGFHARGVDSTTYLVDDIIGSINDIIVNIHTAIADMVTTIPRLLGDLENEIEEIIGNIDISGIVDSIEDAVEDILAAAGIDSSGARSCIDAKISAVEQMVTDANIEIERCARNATSSAEEILNEMNSLRREALDLIVSINAGTAKCMLNHVLNPFRLVRCLKNHLADVREQADDLVRQMANTVATATINVAEITITLTRCTTSITTDLVSTQAQIIANFASCVSNL